MQPDKMELYYFQITDIWKKFCEEHTKLFDLTCDEYSLLLGSEMDKLDDKIKEKESTIKLISNIDTTRSDLINKLNKELSKKEQINSITELITFFQKYEKVKDQKHLFRFNRLLIDIIEKIQAQNKKNQIFINKAIHSLQSIRRDAMGEKTVTTYTARGAAKMRSISE